MSLCRVLLPSTRQLKTLGGVFYQGSKAYSIYAKEPYKQKPVDYEKQSILLPGPERIRAPALIDDPNTPVWTIPGAPEVTTVFNCLQHGEKVSNNGPCFGTRPSEAQEYKWTSYSEVISRVQNIGSGLIQLGSHPSIDSLVGIFASNQEEFTLTLYSTAGYSMVLVPLHITLGQPSVLYIINHAKLPLVITNNETHTFLLLNNIKSLPTLKTIVTFEEPTSEQRRIAQSENVKILSLKEMEEMGKSNKKDFVLPKSDDPFCIPFTSGTTGKPKGAIMTHKNLIACVSSLVYQYGEAGIFGGSIISYLPPAHIYEICNQVASLYFARGIAFYSGPVQNLMEEVRRIKPIILPLVPRLIDGIYKQAMHNIKKSKIKSALLPLAFSQKEKLIRKGKIGKNTIWDKFIFKDFQEQIGGNVHVTSVTSAPVSNEQKLFFVLASGGYVFECYGSTEVLASTMSLPWETNTDNVGCVMSNNHVKLVDVPEMKYYSEDDTGEICIKGANVFKGYLNNPEATNEALIDGWFHIGDIGKFLPNGTLKVIDRKKHLFKLSQGEFIVPEKIEDAYRSCPLVYQVFIDGLSHENFVITLVVPEPTSFKKWLASKGHIKSENLAEILTSKELRKDFLEMLHQYGKKKELNSLEQAKNMAFLSEPFTIENDLLTPTLKMKRNVTRKRYEHIYQKLYEEGPLILSKKS